MRGMSTRLAALEGGLPTVGRLDLSALSDAELLELERIAIRIEEGVPLHGTRDAAIASLPDADLRLIASIRIMPETYDA